MEWQHHKRQNTKNNSLYQDPAQSIKSIKGIKLSLLYSPPQAIGYLGTNISTFDQTAPVYKTITTVYTNFVHYYLTSENFFFFPCF